MIDPIIDAIRAFKQLRNWNGKTKLGFMMRLEDAGCKRLGGGSYSTVWSLPKHPNKCLKVGDSWDSWPAWIYWANKHNYLGTFAPMVYDIKDHRDFYTAVVERLEPLRASKVANTQFEMFNRMIKEPLSPPLDAFRLDVIRYGFTGDWSRENFLCRGDQLVLNDPQGHERGGVKRFTSKSPKQPEIEL